MSTRNYRQMTSPNHIRLASFRQQMADFARGERLRQLRDARHLSQEDAAHEIGVSVKTVRSWEKGGGIRWHNAESAGAFYGVDPDTLVNREGQENSGPTPDLMADLSPGASRRELAAVHEKLDEILGNQALLLASLAEARDAQASKRKPQARGKRKKAASDK